MKTFSSFCMALLLCLAFSAYGSPSFSSPSTPPLPAGMAFFSQIEASPQGYTVTLTPQDGYYIYRDKIKIEGSTQPLTLPQGTTEEDPVFGSVEVYPSSVSFEVSGPRVSLEFQGCQKGGICYPPIQRELSTSSENNTQLPATSSSSLKTEQGISQWLTHASLWQTALVFVGIGLLLALTPCILPLLPVVSSIVLGSEKQSFKHSALLATTYVFSHALVFAGIGIAASLLGKSLALFFQQQFIVVPVMALMAGIGILMMTGVPIQMPMRVQQWAMKQGKGGSVWGAALLGASSSLILGPCLAPPLAGILLYLGNTHDWIVGGISLFCLALGMGIPLVAFSLGIKRILPNLGKKMPNLGTKINLVLGLALFFTASYLVALHWQGVWAWAIAVIAMVGMHGVLKKHSSRTRVQKSLIMVCTALVFYFPLYVWLNNEEEKAQQPSAIIATAEQLSEKIKTAEASEIVMIDFYADWCVECLRMEKTTFKDEKVVGFMKEHQVHPITIDLTEMDAEKEEILRKYQVIGPPVILFYQNGKEIRDLRITGYKKPESFLNTLASASQCESKNLNLAHTC